MTRRLTKILRKEIIDNCINATFINREKELNKIKATLGDAFYDEAIMQKDQDIIKKLPQGFFPNTSSVSIKIITACGLDGVNKYYSIKSRQLIDRTSYITSTLSLSKQRLIPFVFSSRPIEVCIEIPVAELFIHLDKTFAKLNSDINATTAKISGIVHSVNTEAKLLEIWPEAAAYIPPPPPADKPLIVRPHDINQLLATMKHSI